MTAQIYRPRRSLFRVGTRAKGVGMTGLLVLCNMIGLVLFLVVYGLIYGRERSKELGQVINELMKRHTAEMQAEDNE